jgi:hypothetical protein
MSNGRNAGAAAAPMASAVVLGPAHFRHHQLSPTTGPVTGQRRDQCSGATSVSASSKVAA